MSTRDSVRAGVLLWGVPAIVFLAPLYGGGALLICESTQRLGAGWPTRIAFAAAYALVEEAVIDQMVFTPKYLKLDSFAGYAQIPGIDTSATLLAASLTMDHVEARIARLDPPAAKASWPGPDDSPPHLTESSETTRPTRARLCREDTRSPRGQAICAILTPKRLSPR